MSLWLHTDGKYILDGNNQVMQMRGAVFRPNKLEQDIIVAKQDLDEASQLGVRFVRVETSASTWLNPSAYPTRISWFHEFLSHAKLRSIRVFASVHGEDVEDLDVLVHPDNYVPLWNFMAEEYKNDDALVGLGYWNEPALWYLKNPLGYTKEQIQAMYYNLAYKVASSLRQINPNLLILVGGDGDGLVGLSQTVPFSNVAYVFNQHYTYAQRWEWYDLFYQGRIEEGKQSLLNFLQTQGCLRLQNVPLLNMEWGFVPDRDLNWQQVAQAMFEVMEDNNIGWMGWAWSVGSPTSSASLLSSRYVLTPWGQIWRGLIQTPIPTENIFVDSLPQGIPFTMRQA